MAKLIAFEGIDGSGKTTQAGILFQRLPDSVLLREPGHTPLGEIVREILLDPHHQMTPLSELLFFMVSRAQLYHQVIKPALQQNKNIILDRYRLSSIAYQGYGRGININLINQLNNQATENRKPDITFLIDVPPEIAMTRKYAADRIEQETLDFYHRVRQGFLETAADDPTIIVVNGQLPIKTIAAIVSDRLEL